MAGRTTKPKGDSQAAQAEATPTADPSKDLEVQKQAGTATTKENEAATASAREKLRAQAEGENPPPVGEPLDAEGFGRKTMEESVAAQVRPRRYTSGEGLEAGNRASKTLFLDDKGKVTEKRPERGRVLTSKGSPVSPASARIIAAAKKSK